MRGLAVQSAGHSVTLKGRVSPWKILEGIVGTLHSARLDGHRAMGDNPTPNNLPKWRNWQTHQIQGLAPSRVSGFKSRLRHQLLYSAAIPGTWRAAFSCRVISVFRRVIAASNVSALIAR